MNATESLFLLCQLFIQMRARKVFDEKKINILVLLTLCGKIVDIFQDYIFVRSGSWLRIYQLSLQ